MGLVLDKNKFRKRPVLSEEKLDNSAPLEASPKKSLCHYALQCGLAESTACTEDNGAAFFRKQILNITQN
jgi:hypothetical protein